jgi:DNA-binding NarL/FixJ family response regulator
MGKKIIVHVVHRNITTRTGIHALLSARGDFIVKNLSPERPDIGPVDVLVTDYVSGIDLAAAASSMSRPAPKLLVVTERIKEWDIRSALDAGIRGFLAQDCDVDELAQAIHCLDDGNVFLSQSVQVLAQRSMGRSRLTAREKQVLELLGKGCSNKLIARELGIAEVTAKIHLQKLMEKLDATTRTHAVAIAIELGLMCTGADATVAPAAQLRRIGPSAPGLKDMRHA